MWLMKQSYGCYTVCITCTDSVSHTLLPIRNAYVRETCEVARSMHVFRKESPFKMQFNAGLGIISKQKTRPIVMNTRRE